MNAQVRRTLRKNFSYSWSSNECSLKVNDRNVKIAERYVRVNWA